MKLLIFNNLYQPNDIGGAGESVRLLAESFVRNGHNVTVVSLHDEENRIQREINGVKVHYEPLKNTHWPYYGSGDTSRLRSACWYLLDQLNPFMMKGVSRIIDTANPDLVHTNNLAGFSVGIWWIVKRKNLPLIHTMRDYYLLCLRSSLFRKGHYCESLCFECRGTKTFKHNFSHLPDLYSAPSNAVIQQHSRHGFLPKSKPTRVIPNGASSSSNVEKHHHKINDHSLVLGYLGRIHPSKGLEKLIKTLLSEVNFNWTLLVGGSLNNNHASKLQDQYQNTPISFLGYVDPTEFFKKINILIAPSLWPDPLPRTIFEAYHHGIPVIGSNRGGIPEMINHGKTGYIYDPENPESLETLLKKIADNNNLYSKLHAGASEKAQDYTVNRMGKRYIKSYRSLLK